MPELHRIAGEIFSAAIPLMVQDAASQQTVTISVLAARTVPGGGHSEIAVDGEHVTISRSEGVIVNHIETIVTDKLARHYTDYMLLHSGALEINGKGIILPGTSGNGKSTSTTCLALSGFTYYSDELAVCSPDGSRLFPFPKVPGLKAGGRKVVETAFGEQSHILYTPEINNVTYFEPPRLPTQKDAQAGVPIKFVLLPRQPRQGETTVRPVKKSEALTMMVEESLDLRLRHAAGFEALSSIVTNAECYEIRLGDVHKGIEMVRKLTTG